MNAVDVKCPICETLNKSLNLEETDGWMECENCGNVVQILKYVKTRRIPSYQMSDAKLLMALSKGQEGEGNAARLDDLLLVLPKL